MPKKILLVSYLLLFTFIAKSQTGISISNFNGVDNLVNNFLSTWNIEGGEVAITKNGKLIYNRGFGYADQSSSEIAKPYHLYRIASVSKPITSIAIMKLIEDGSLSITDTVFGVNKILDQAYYVNAITDNRIYQITIQNLLEHTGGWDSSIPCNGFTTCDPIDFPLYVSSSEGAANPVGDSTLIRFILRKTLNNNPGSTFAYSNMGYLILGKVIEKITSMKYDEYVRSILLDPLSLCDVHLGKNLLADKQEREGEYNSPYTVPSCYGTGATVPYQYGGFNLEAMNAHGQWIATASDLTKMILAVDNLSTFPDILNPSTINLMTSPSTALASAAKGWFVNTSNNWWHTGSLPGTSTFICRTGTGYTWAFLFNSRSTGNTAYYNALDALPWNCISAITTVPNIDLYPPTSNLSNISASILGLDSMNLNWTNGNGDGRIIIATEDSVFSKYPVDGTSYNASPIFGSGTDLGNGTFVVYNGSGNNFTISNLDPTKTYRISGFEYFKNTNTNNFEVYKLGCAENTNITTSNTFVDPLVMQENIKIFPNPTNNFFEIETSFNGAFLVEVFNESGMKILTKNSGSEKLFIDLTDYSSGIYIIKLTHDNKYFTKSLVRN